MSKYARELGSDKKDRIWRSFFNNFAPLLSPRSTLNDRFYLVHRRHRTSRSTPFST